MEDLENFIKAYEEETDFLRRLTNEFPKVPIDSICDTYEVFWKTLPSILEIMKNDDFRGLKWFTQLYKNKSYMCYRHTRAHLGGYI